jgi:hypothetical protein
MTKATSGPPLGGFEQRLLGELRELVEQHGAAQAPRRNSGSAPRSRWRLAAAALPRRSFRRSLAATGALVVAVSAAVLITLSAGSTPILAQAFPILKKPGTVIPRAALASILNSNGTTVMSSGAHLAARHARAFETPLGTGYVVTDTGQNLLCVAAPGLSPKNWGAACGPADDALRQGTGAMLSYSASEPDQVFVVDILPEGATATIQNPGGQPRPLPISDGVLAVVASTSDRITTNVAGHPTALYIPSYQQTD